MHGDGEQIPGIALVRLHNELDYVRLILIMNPMYLGCLFISEP